MPKALGKSLSEDLTANPKGGDPKFIDKQNILHTGREVGIFVTFETKLTEYSTPPKGSAFALNNGSFIARHDYGCN